MTKWLVPAEPGCTLGAQSTLVFTAGDPASALPFARRGSIRSARDAR